jgi:type VI secretion system protein ImpI
MILILKILGPVAEQLGSGACHRFNAAGGSIGRSSDNQWVIPSRYISNRHAVIHYRAGCYFLEDTSSNGVFFGNRDNRMPTGLQQRLDAGDRFFIDELEVEVEIAGSDAAVALRRSAAPERARGMVTKPLDLDAIALGGPGIDVTSYEITSYGLADPPTLSSAQSVSGDFDKTSVLVNEMAPRGPAEASAPRLTVRDAAPQAPQAPPDLVALLLAAGAPAAAATSTTASELGEMLRVMVAGVIATLGTREKIKEEFGLRHTTFKVADNNPLKFSANVEDALHNLLVKRNSAYLGPAEAFDDAFADVRNHQTATLAAMQAAFNRVLQRFSPERLREHFDEKSARTARLSLPGKGRYWEQYNEHFQDLVKDPDNTFRELFGAEFARAYEDQMLALRDSSRNRKRGS